MKKKILLINRGADTDNFGDQAIHLTLTRLFENKNCQVSAENYTKPTTIQGSKYRSFFENILYMIRVAIKNSEIVIIGGGQLILSNKKFPISFLCWVLAIKIFSTSKIYLYGVGVDDCYSLLSRNMYRTGLYFTDGIYVRDTKSRINMKTSFKKDSTVIPDAVTILSSIYKTDHRHEYRDYVLFGITHYSSIKKYGYMDIKEEEYLASQAEILMDPYLDGRKILIYNTDADRSYAFKFQNYLKKKFDKNIDVYSVKDLDDYLSLVSCSKMVISSRMHALIVALSFNVGIYPVIRNKKLESFVSEYLPFQKVEDYAEQIDNSINEIIYSS